MDEPTNNQGATAIAEPAAGTAADPASRAGDGELAARRASAPSTLALFRDGTIEVVPPDPTATRAAGDDAARPTYRIALSSETPVERYDWWEDERFLEVLDHAPGAVDLSYSRDGLPILTDHNTREHVGIMRNVTLGADRVLRGDVTFSRSTRGREVEQDVADGIRQKVSVGYMIDRNNYSVTPGKGANALPTRRYAGWKPTEGSFVAIPADYAVGVGRSAHTHGDADVVRRTAEAVVRELVPRLTLHAPTTGATERNTVDTDTASAPANSGGNGGAATITIAERDQAIAAERKRANDIRAMVRKHGFTDAQVDAFVDSGRSVEAVAAEVLTSLADRGAAAGMVGRPTVALTDNERKQYSFARALDVYAYNQEVDGRAGVAKRTSFELEINDELSRNFPQGATRRGGLLVPTFTDAARARDVMAEQNGWGQRAGLDSATAGKGAEVKFTVPGDFIDLLRNYLATMHAGVGLLAGLQGPVAFPKQTGAASVSWVGENPGADVGDSNLTLTQVALAPKTVMSSTSFSRQLLAQSVVDVDGMVRNDLAQILAVGLDAAILNGAGGNAPTGILGTAGIGSVAMGVNGGTPGYANMVDLETQVTTANADQWPLTYLAHPTTRGTLKKATVLGATNATPVWTKASDDVTKSRIQGLGSRVVGEVNGYAAYATSQMPNTLTKGTSAGNCLAILLGAFSQAVLGDWGVMEILTDPYRLKKQGMLEVTMFGLYGFAVKYPSAFAAILDALP